MLVNLEHSENFFEKKQDERKVGKKIINFWVEAPEINHHVCVCVCVCVYSDDLSPP